MKPVIETAMQRVTATFKTGAGPNGISDRPGT